MDKPAKRTVLITGASSGVGKACASALIEDGYRIYGTYRSSKPRINAETGNRPSETGSLTMLHMNVNDEISVTQGIQSILEKEQRIDVVIQSAGYALAGAIEDTSVLEAKQLFDTNLWGVQRVSRAVLPSMRKQGSGLIINISSIAGVVALPFQGFYCASKYALEAMTEALRMEVNPFGIHVVLVEPGDLATEFTANRHVATASREESAYVDKFSGCLKLIEHEERHGTSPERVAQTVRKILKQPSPKLRYRVGSPLQKSSVFLKKILPNGLFEWIIMKFYGLT